MRYSKFFLMAAALVAAPALQAEAVKVWQGTLTLPVHEEGLPDPNPPFDTFAPAGRYNYPYTLRTSLTGVRAEHALRALFLENEYLKCSVLPDIGGHLFSCTDKLSGAEMFYANPSIKKQLIGYRGAWAAFGIEFNFPVSHNWMSMSPVDFATRANADGSASVFVSNIDRPYGMQWMVELMLRPGSTVLEQKVTLYNRSDLRRRYYYWNNAGIEVTDDSRVQYPMRFAASHGFTFVDTWPVDHTGRDNSLIRNQTAGTVSMFVHGSREPFMGVWHPHNQTGIAHYAEYDELPAKKIWSWGVDPDGLDWRKALSDNNSAYVEVQAGLFRNQETYAFLPPQATLRFTEYWIPVRAIGGISRANRDAAVFLTRDGGRLIAKINVNHAVPGAVVRLRAGSQVLAERKADLAPKTMVEIDATAPAEGVKGTVEIVQGEKVLLAHTEGTYDWTPASEIKTGPQPAVDRTHDALELGTDQELNGARLEAAATYARALEADASNFELNKAAGELDVALKNYPRAIDRLERALLRRSNDDSIDYYLGVAYWAEGNATKARAHWEAAQRQQGFRAQARLQLARVSASPAEALRWVRAALAEQPEMTRAAGLEVALLRTLDQKDEARQVLARYRAQDPTNAFLRVEAVKLGGTDEALWRHLSADPERVMEAVVDYLHIGLYQDALDLVARDYPAIGEGESEPGMPRPQEYALAAYYRAYCEQKLGHGSAALWQRAAAMPMRYVFPYRPEDLMVLRAALAANANDAHAHFLLGSLRMAGGQTDAAIAEWTAARRLDATIPVLHRNLGRTLLVEKHEDARALEVLTEGLRVDPTNVELYTSITQAESLLKRPASERVAALLRYPDRAKMPSALVFDLALSLAEGERFDEARALFANRFFERQEGGVNVRQVYLEVRLMEALARAKSDPGAAEAIVKGLGAPVHGLAFTNDGLAVFLDEPRFQYYLGVVEARRGQRAAAEAHWRHAQQGRDAFAVLAARSLGAADWREKAEQALTHRGAAYQRGVLQSLLGRDAEAQKTLQGVLRGPDQRLSHYLARRAMAGLGTGE